MHRAVWNRHSETRFDSFVAPPVVEPCAYWHPADDR
jgi:hypothetical protein